MHMKYGCTALKYSLEYNAFPSFFEESYLFPKYSHRVLFSWPLSLGTKKFRPGPTGYNRIVFTHLCEFVAVIAVKSAQLSPVQRTVSLCPQISKVASLAGPIPNMYMIKDELDRIRCGDQVMVKKEFVISATNRICERKLRIQKSIWKPAPEGLYPSDNFWSIPLHMFTTTYNRGLNDRVVSVVDGNCKLQGMLYLNSGKWHHCTEARVTSPAQYDADDSTSHQEIDEHEESLLKKTDRFMCSGVSLDNEIITKNFKVAKDFFKINLMESKKRKEGEENKHKNKKEKDLPYPRQSLEGHMWLWPLRLPEIPNVRERKNQVYFMLGLDSSKKLTGVYYTTSKANRKRRLKRCLGRHETNNGGHDEVTLGRFHNNPIGD
ncbi:unnamed protein product [Blumeria hordei]|uniref:Uncharacterized protein n=1 Tax=Blumeria hordei TaxID=2867405 RepID=A0A383USY0_BLUHO|nr:unnamed protein product [Blumeria hordei]